MTLQEVSEDFGQEALDPVGDMYVRGLVTMES